MTRVRACLKVAAVETLYHDAGQANGAGNAFCGLVPSDPRIRRVETLARQNLHRKLCLRDLAGVAGLSTSRLCHLFKDALGAGPARYLKQLRLRTAKELLENSTLSVKEIAARTGLGDVSHFVKDFRQLYGETPSRYRLQLSQQTGTGNEIDGGPREAGNRQLLSPTARFAYKQQDSPINWTCQKEIP